MSVWVKIEGMPRYEHSNHCASVSSPISRMLAYPAIADMQSNKKSPTQPLTTHVPMGGTPMSNFMLRQRVIFFRTEGRREEKRRQKRATQKNGRHEHKPALASAMPKKSSDTAYSN